MKRIKEVAQRRQEAQTRLNAKREELEGLSAIINNGVNPELRAATGKALSAKEEAIRRFALGKAGQADLEQARKNYQSAQQDEQNAQEVFEATEDLYAATREEVDFLERIFRDEDRDAWMAVSNHIEAQIKGNEKLFILVHEAFAAKRKALGFNVPFDRYCGELFKDPALEGSRELTDKLEKQYLSS